MKDEYKGSTPVFWESRKKHGRVTYEIAKRVAEHRRAYLRLQPNGRVRVYGYSPELQAWVRVIVTGDGLLYKGFVDEDARDTVHRIAREGR